MASALQGSTQKCHMSFLLLFYRLKEPMATPNLERRYGPMMGTSRHISDYPGGPPPSSPGSSRSPGLCLVRASPCAVCLTLSSEAEWPSGPSRPGNSVLFSRRGSGTSDDLAGAVGQPSHCRVWDKMFGRGAGFSLSCVF